MTLTLKMIEEPLVYCERCKGPGGSAYRGWQLLCPDCSRADQDWYDE
jgi:hypothetical protein